jgi:hypothetical protein
LIILCFYADIFPDSCALEISYSLHLQLKFFYISTIHHFSVQIDASFSSESELIQIPELAAIVSSSVMNEILLSVMFSLANPIKK